MAGDTDPDRPRLTGEDLDRIRARLSARANLGVDPASPAFLDAILGSIFGDLEGPAALELDEFYDFVEVVARATIPATSFGEWLDDWAESLGLERRDEAFAGGVLRFTGTPGSEIAAGQQVTTVTEGDEDPVAVQVIAGGIIDGTGSIDLDATAVVAGSAGNVPAGTLVRPALEIDGVSAVTNPNAMTGGADVENDEQLNGRVRDALAGDVGAGTQADYRRWGMAWPGVGHVTVRPVARGAGTVDVFITDLNNDPMPAAAVDGLQAQLDPVTGEGLGLAPIGHDVLVLTPSAFAVAIAATLEFDEGYTLDGTAGTRAKRAELEAALARYVNGLDVGAPVIRDKVVAALVDVRGVTKTTALTLNGGAGDLAVPADEVATIDPTPDLTE